MCKIKEIVPKTLASIDLSIKKHKKTFIISLTTILAVFVFYVGYGINQKIQNKFEAQQVKINELQNYTNGQIRLVEEKKSREETDANQKEISDKINQCNKAKDSCKEKISNLEISIQDQKNNLANKSEDFEKTKKSMNDLIEDLKGTDMDTSDLKKSIGKKEAAVVLEENKLKKIQEELHNLINGECKDYKNMVCE